jgi:HAD superfamily hydrolase (TIGR01484 family)
MNSERETALGTTDVGSAIGKTTVFHGHPVRAVVFDLDNTLAPSKSRLADTTAILLERLLAHVDVCIIPGGSFGQFERQVLQYLSPSPVLAQLHLMPTCGTEYYRWRTGSWRQVYSEALDASAKEHITSVLAAGSRTYGFDDLHTWGATIEDRGTQITYSTLGQQAPIGVKVAWDADGAKRRSLHAYAARRLPDFEVRIGGSTSIDVTNKGIDKAYGISKLQQELDLDIDDLLFLGDRLDVDGNEYPVKAMGVTCIEVTDWRDTEQHIVGILEAYGADGTEP